MSERASARPRPRVAEVALGVVVAPGLARDVTAKIVAELADDLAELETGVDWRPELRVDRLVVPPALTTEIVRAARQKLLDEDWDLAIVVTDLPLRVGRRPVSRQVSPTHGVAVISLPALGALHLTHRLRRTLLALVGELVGSGASDRSNGGPLAGLRRRWGRGALRELATDTAARPGALRILFVPTVLTGNLRLLLGMVRANRPWRLAARLYRALVAAAATAAYGLVSGDVWRISATMGPARLAIVCVASVLVTSTAVIVAHGLWEQAPDRRLRDQVILFNFATAATVVIGIGSLYVALFLLIFAAPSCCSARASSPRDWATQSARATTPRSPGSPPRSQPSAERLARASSRTKPCGRLPTPRRERATRVTTIRSAPARRNEMELAGLEPATSWVRSRRSPN